FLFIFVPGVGPLTTPCLHQAFKHSVASITLSDSRFRSGIIIRLAPEKTRSHSVDIAGQDSRSKAYRYKEGNLIRLSLYQRIGLNSISSSPSYRASDIKAV